MKPSRWLALGTALAGCAVAYGIHLFGKHDAASPATASSPKSKTAAAERSRSGFESTAETRAHHRQQGGATELSPAIAAVRPRKISGSPSATGNVLSEPEWRDRAAKVEMEANHELARLSGLLDLDPVQQDKVFSNIARQSRYWSPGMQTVGGATETPAGSSQPENADLTAYLNADQQQTLVEAEMDRQEWWAEVLPQLLPPSISDGSSVASPDVRSAASAVDTNPAPETKVFDGGDVLLNE
jgi:hypothetical protein